MVMEKKNVLTINDISFLDKLCQRTYTGNTMMSNASSKENDRYKNINHIMQNILQEIGNEIFGEENFNVGGKSGNPLTRSGRLGLPWACIYKSKNKQYGPQISLVIHKDGIRFGFFFGCASSHGLTKAENDKRLNEFKSLSKGLHDKIVSSEGLKVDFEQLSELGFTYFKKNQEVSSYEWLNQIASDPSDCSITVYYDLKKNRSIDSDILKSYCYSVLFLYNAVDVKGTKKANYHKRNFHLSLRERFHKLELLKEIGDAGELFIFNKEKEKIKRLGYDYCKYPELKSEKDDSCGYDILSLDDKGNEIFLEVKTTIKKRGDSSSKQFFMSGNEWNTYMNSINNYRLYRVYDVNLTPEYEEIDLSKVNIVPHDYIISY